MTATFNRRDKPDMGQVRAADDRVTFDQLVDYFSQGCKPRQDWRIGTEHEKFIFDRQTLKPLSYEGERGIGAWLKAMGVFGWQPIYEGLSVIALRRGQASITLEPGGQVELSGAPLVSVHETCAEITTHLNECQQTAKDMDIGFLGVGYLPKWQRGDVFWVPKARYQIMRDYMPGRGGLGLDMMSRTCGVQANFDYGNEASMVQAFRICLALQPLAVALFANSPFTQGQPNGYHSYRSHVWNDTDPDRCGIPACVFEDGFGFERYADWVLDVPMYFIRRDGRYIDTSGQSFRNYMDGRLENLPGQYPNLDDWIDHLSTVFTEVRLKTFIEVRGADSGSRPFLCALSALWCGLLYDEDTASQVADMIAPWGLKDHQRLRDQVPKHGLETMIEGRSLRGLGRDVLALARRGLVRRAVTNPHGQDESHFLDILDQVIDSGKTHAEAMLDSWKTDWNQNIDRIYHCHAYDNEGVTGAIQGNG